MIHKHNHRFLYWLARNDFWGNIQKQDYWFFIFYFILLYVILLFKLLLADDFEGNNVSLFMRTLCIMESEGRRFLLDSTMCVTVHSWAPRRVNSPVGETLIYTLHISLSYRWSWMTELSLWLMRITVHVKSFVWVRLGSQLRGATFSSFEYCITHLPQACTVLMSPICFFIFTYIGNVFISFIYLIVFCCILLVRHCCCMSGCKHKHLTF